MDSTAESATFERITESDGRDEIIEITDDMILEMTDSAPPRRPTPPALPFSRRTRSHGRQVQGTRLGRSRRRRR